MASIEKAGMLELLDKYAYKHNMVFRNYNMAHMGHNHPSINQSRIIKEI